MSKGKYVRCCVQETKAVHKVCALFLKNPGQSSKKGLTVDGGGNI